MAAAFDALVVGGGIAGAAAAWALAEAGAGRTVLVEAEDQLARHTTGRSAAAYIVSYGAPAIRRLTIASRAVITPFLAPRPLLMIGRADQLHALDAAAELGRRFVPEVARLDGAASRRCCAALRPEQIVGGVLDPTAADIDVHGLHQHFLAGFRAEGGVVRVGAPVRALRRVGGAWEAELGGSASGETVRAALVVNAAGAWGDELALLAGAAPVGLRPLRRTAFTVPTPAAHADAAAAWPLVVDVDEGFYFKPEAGQLLCSLADETPSPPCDARPEEADVALAIERIEAAAELGIRHVRAAWAGLRTFSPDRVPVVGEDPARPGFYWFTGQGGYGIQTAPAMGLLLAGLVTAAPLAAPLAAAGVDPAELDPRRFTAPPPLSRPPPRR